MATAGFVEALLGSLDATTRKAFRAVFDYVLRNLRFGTPQHGTASENFQGYFYETTTAAVANTEFSIVHGLGRVPYLVIPILPLDAVGSKIVPLTVTRAADSSRVYLSSSVTSAAIVLYVEA
jgi:hypothetical protein